MSDSESDQENQESLEEVYSRVQVSFDNLQYSKCQILRVTTGISENLREGLL